MYKNLNVYTTKMQSESKNHTMLFRLKFQYTILFVILFTRQSSGLKYLFVPEIDPFFGNCLNAAPNVLSIKEFIDSELIFTQKDDKISVSGNCSLKWDIQPGDRVMISFQLFKFDRIKWIQTPYGITVPNICPILYDEPQYWYKYWTQHVTNKEEVKDKCVYPGTKLIHEPFLIHIKFDFTGVPLSGRHKIVITIRGFNKMHVERETSICIEIAGELERLN